MFRVLLDIFLLYLAYQFIFNFLVPVVRTTRQVKKGFRDMRDQMNQAQNQQQANQAQPSPPPKSPDTRVMGEYIEFEDVK